LFDYLGHSRGTGTQRVIHRSGLKGIYQAEESNLCYTIWQTPRLSWPGIR